MPILAILEASVEGGMPSWFAALFFPEIFPSAFVRAWRIMLRSRVLRSVYVLGSNVCVFVLDIFG